MEPLNIAIIGARGVGKSSFVQRLLGLPRAPDHNASCLRLAVDDRDCRVLLLELDLEHFDMAPEGPIQWPRQVDGQILPRVDGALILYDVTNKETIMELPRTLGKASSPPRPLAGDGRCCWNEPLRARLSLVFLAASANLRQTL